MTNVIKNLLLLPLVLGLALGWFLTDFGIEEDINYLNKIHEESITKNIDYTGTDFEKTHKNYLAHKIREGK